MKPARVINEFWTYFQSLIQIDVWKRLENKPGKVKDSYMNTEYRRLWTSLWNYPLPPRGKNWMGLWNSPKQEFSEL